MKSIKTLAAGFLACALGTAAFAVSSPTHLYIIGSTAFRKSTVQSVEDAMGTGTYKVAYVGTGGGELGANMVIISGTIGGNPVIVKFNWTGSVTGVQSLINGTTFSNAFLSDTQIPATASNTATAIPSASAVFDGAEAANITLSDSHPSSTGLNTSGLTAQEVGVIVFEWVVNNGAPAAITNITTLQAQALLSGSLVLSQFTGVAGDSATPIWAVGRSGDSGTRLSYLAETGLGLTASVFQVQVTSATISGVNTVTTLDAFGGNVGSVSDPFLGNVAPGQSGYASGGSAAGAMVPAGSAAVTVTSSTGVTPGYLISYLGRSDAATACAGGATRLTFNGIADFNSATAGTTSSLNTPIIEGQYQGWEYESLVHKSSLADGGQFTGSKELTLTNAIITQILADPTADALAGIQLSAMHTNRGVEGGTITHN